VSFLSLPFFRVSGFEFWPKWWMSLNISWFYPIHCDLGFFFSCSSDFGAPTVYGRHIGLSQAAHRANKLGADNIKMTFLYAEVHTQCWRCQLVPNVNKLSCSRRNEITARTGTGTGIQIISNKWYAGVEYGSPWLQMEINHLEHEVHLNNIKTFSSTSQKAHYVRIAKKKLSVICSLKQ
jgi:hypothetical protein